MKNTQNKVSIVIPTYKRADKLNRALESCLKQTYENIEIIVVDDNVEGSSYRNETEKTMKKYLEQKKVKYIKMKKNGGGAAARNFGIDNATGDYIAFLDDDDEFVYNKIEKHLNFMISNNLDASFSNQRVLNEQSGQLIYETKHKNFDNSFNQKQVLVYHLTDMIIGTQTFMYKKDALLKVGKFDIVPSGQEYILMYKTIIEGLKIGHLDSTLVNIYIHENERISTSKRKLEGEKNLYKIKRKHFNVLNFSQKRQVKYELLINHYRYYKKNKSVKFLLYLIITIFNHPIKVINRFNKRNA